MGTGPGSSCVAMLRQYHLQCKQQTLKIGVYIMQSYAVGLWTYRDKSCTTIRDLVWYGQLLATPQYTQAVI